MPAAPKKTAVPVAAPAAPAPAAPKAAAAAPKAAAVAAPASAAAPAKAKVAPKQPVPVAAAPAAPAAPVETEEPAAVSPLVEITTLLTALTAAVAEIRLKLKPIQREFDRMKKISERVERRRATARSTPSGFAKPLKLSAEMCSFLGEPAGTELSRTDVTRRLTQYIKTHNLNNPENKRFIIPDAALTKILDLKGDEQLSYFSIQKHLKPHFVKAA